MKPKFLEQCHSSYLMDPVVASVEILIIGSYHYRLYCLIHPVPIKMPTQLMKPKLLEQCHSSYLMDPVRLLLQHRPCSKKDSSIQRSTMTMTMTMLFVPRLMKDAAAAADEVVVSLKKRRRPKQNRQE